MNSKDALALVEQVHGLYQAAFADFVLVVGVVVGVTGVLLPIFFTVTQFYQQKRESRIANEKLDALVNAAVEEVEARLRQDNAKALEAFASRSENQLKQSREETEKKLNRLEAATLHVQARGLFRSKEYVEASRSATGAVSGYLGSSDHLNLRRVIEGIVSPCMKELGEKDFKGSAVLESSVRDAIAAIRGADECGAFADLLDSLELDLTAALARVAE